jgi:hypothetical protein
MKHLPALRVWILVLALATLGLWAKVLGIELDVRFPATALPSG